VFRAAHSIKGGAGTFGFDAIAGLTHVLETLLDELRPASGRWRPAVDAMLSSVDVLRALLREAEHGQAADVGWSGGEGAPEAVLSGQAAPEAAAKSAEDVPEAWQIGFVPAPSLFMSGNDPLRIIRELEHLGSLQVAARMSACPASPRTRWKPTWRGTWAWSARCRAARSKTPSPGSGRLRAGHPSGRAAEPQPPHPRRRLRRRGSPARRRPRLPGLRPGPSRSRRRNLDPRQRRQGRCADQPGRRTGHHPGHAQAGLAALDPVHAEACSPAWTSLNAIPATCRKR
jgi:HPt (histidine-containing phosphotransfer) domain-containing protein